MPDPDGARVFGLPPGVDFAAELARGLIARHADAAGQLAHAEVFVNTSRMAGALREALTGPVARLLPRVRLVTDLANEAVPGLAPAVPYLRRRLELAELVAALARHDDRLLKGATLFDLGDSLADLMAEMHEEGVGPEKLASPDLAGDHAEHWERSLRFLNLVAKWFAPGAAPDASARQRQVTERLVAIWEEAPPDHPVIVAGSTGSRGTTALLMEAVAALPQGALVLPGFDFDMPEALWDRLGSGDPPADDHPQYRYARLIRQLGLRPSDVRRWTGTEPPSVSRNRLFSLSLRPAPVTDSWMLEGPGLGDLGAATAGVTLLEAPSQRAEATAIAVALREAAEHGRRAALVTPDRVLARRVTSALERWNIVPDDSAGEPLSQTPPGRFLRQISALFGQDLTSGALLSMLKHPLASAGSDRGNHLRLARDLELRIRAKGPAFPAARDLTAFAAKREKPAQDWAAWVAATLCDLADLPARPAPDWAGLLLDRATALSLGPDAKPAEAPVWSGPAGRQARAVLDGLMAEREGGLILTAAMFHDLLGRLLSAEGRREPVAAHPLVSIWGTLEARARNADLMILAGLNEGSWPQMPGADPWMSRQMRQNAGLRSPEREVGLSAHDFQQAAAAPEVILSRSRRDAEAETVPSRWLSRVLNLMAGLEAQGGKAAIDAMKDRGNRLLDLARIVEAPLPATPAPRPAARPPVEFRPRNLPITSIRKLILNPYAVYAGYVLRLRKLATLAPAPDARAKGEALHLVMEDFVRSIGPDDTPEAMRDRLIATAERILEDEVPWVAPRLIWLSRLRGASDALIEGERARQAGGQPVLIEERGRARVEDTEVTLNGRPDRVDRLTDGRLRIVDYKSGAVPTKPEITTYEMQLALAAGIARRGGFPALGQSEAAEMAYVSLKDAKEVAVPDPAVEIERAWSALKRLLLHYDNPATGYIARLYDHDTRLADDFDDLARFGEWDLSDEPEGGA